MSDVSGVSDDMCSDVRILLCLLCLMRSDVRTSLHTRVKMVHMVATMTAQSAQAENVILYPRTIAVIRLRYAC